MSSESDEDVPISPRKHDDVSDYSNSPSSENPLGDAFNIMVSLPESINIRIVDASILEDYEVWIFIASFLASAVVGFVVALIQARDSKSASAEALFWISIVVIVLFVVALVMAFKKRSSLRRKGRTVKLRTSSATDVKSTKS